MPKTVLVVALLALAATVGCASRPKYDLAKQNIHISAKKVPLRVAVTTFTDARPQEERTLDARKAKGGAENAEDYLGSYTYDEDFVDSEIAGPLADMTARHLDESRLFEDADYVAVPSEQVTAERAKNGDFKEFDAVLVGKMTHMWGYMYKSVLRQALFLPMGGTGLTLNTLIPAPIRGEAELVEVKLISTKDGRVLWEGTLSAKVDEDKMLNNTKKMTAMALWRKMINQLCQKLEEAAPSLSSN